MKKNTFYLFIVALIVALPTGLSAQDIVSDLVLELGFGNSVDDLTGNTTPIASGMEIYTEDRDGNPFCAIGFNGQTDEFIEIPANTTNDLVQGDEFTISAWFRMNNTILGNYEVLFQKGGTPTSGFEMALYDLNTPVIGDNTFDLGIWDNDWNSDPNLPFDITNWHHYVMVVSNSEVQLYRDNVLRNNLVYTGTEFNIGSTVLNYQIGEGFIGFLDDIRLYKRALTAQEVGLLFDLPTFCPVLGVEDFRAITIVQSSNNDIELNYLSQENHLVEVFDISGKKVSVLNGINNTNNRFNLSSLSRGMYIIRVTENLSGRTSSHKVIIE